MATASCWENAFSSSERSASRSARLAAAGRLATVDQHMSGRLDALGGSVDDQVGRLAVSIDAHHRASAEELEAVRSQHAAGVATVAHEVTALSERVDRIHDDLAALNEVVAGLGETVAGLRRPVSRGRETPRRRRGWNSTP